MRANIYRGGRYVFGVVYDLRTLRKQKGFMIEASIPIKNGTPIASLLKPLPRPNELVMLKTEVHTCNQTADAKENPLIYKDAKIATFARKYSLNHLHNPPHATFFKDRNSTLRMYGTSVTKV